MQEYEEMTIQELEKEISNLRAFRSREARGSGPEAAHVRQYVRTEILRIRKIIRERNGHSEYVFGPTALARE